MIPTNAVSADCFAFLAVDHEQTKCRAVSDGRRQREQKKMKPKKKMPNKNGYSADDGAHNRAVLLLWIDFFFFLYLIIRSDSTEYTRKQSLTRCGP